MRPTPTSPQVFAQAVLASMLGLLLHGCGGGTIEPATSPPGSSPFQETEPVSSPSATSSVSTPSASAAPAGTATPSRTPQPTPSLPPGPTPGTSPSATPGSTPAATPSSTPSSTPSATPPPTGTPGLTPTLEPPVTPSLPPVTPSLPPVPTPSATPIITPTPWPDGRLLLTPDALTFYTAPGEPVTAALQLEHLSGAPVSLLDVTASDLAFSIAPELKTDLPLTLTQGELVSIPVTFYSEEAAAVTGELMLELDPPGPDPLIVPLLGEAIVCYPDPLGDADADGICGSDDLCPSVADPEQADLDLDGLGDLCDSDLDGDSVPNSEDAYPLDPAASDYEGPDSEAPARFLISDQPVVLDSERFGDNLPGAEFLNNTTYDPGFEPTLRRFKFVAQGGTDQSFLVSNPNWYQTWTDGFWDGARVDVYRIVAGEVTPIRSDFIQRWWAENRRQVSPLPGANGFSTTVKAPTVRYSDLNLTNGATYFYELEAVDTSGNRSVATARVSTVPSASLGSIPFTQGTQNLSTSVTDSTAPSTPIGFKATAYNGAIALEWTASSETDLAGYRVTRLQTLYPVSSLTFVDSGLQNGKTYYYQVEARDTSGNGSSLSAEVSATPAASAGTTPIDHVITPMALLPSAQRDSASPAAPTGVAAAGFDQAVRLTWSAVSATDLAGYTIKRYERAPADRNRADLASPGPAIQAEDILHVYLKELETDRSTVYDRAIDGQAALMAKTNNSWGVVGGATYQKLAHTMQEVEQGGDSYARLSVGTSSTVSIRQYRYGHPSSTYMNLEPGAPYRMEAWMRQTGIPSSQVRFYMNSNYAGYVDTRFSVDGTWRRYTYDFTGPPMPTAGSSIIQHILEFTGPGALEVDNFVIYAAEAGREAFDLWPPALEEMTRFHPGTLRIWSGQTNVGGGVSLDNWTRPEMLNQRMWDVNNGPTSAPSYHLGEALEFALEVGATPWLIVNPMLAEEEWQGLLEYLAAPCLDEVSTPWACRRQDFRDGLPLTWLDEFDSILLEYGNETWSVGFFEPQAYSGLSGAGVSGAELMGLFAEHFFQAMQESPWWTPELADRIELMVNGWAISSSTTGYGATALQAAPSARYTDTTVYNGGWEAGLILGGSTVNDTGFADVLTFGVRSNQPNTDLHVATREALTAQGRPYRLGVYEGGPSYALPNPGTPYNTVTEQYGKSLASAIATADSYYYNSLQGYGPQGFFLFAAGYNWSSHSPEGYGFNPHTAWLALELRNRFASGDMLLASALDVPTVDLPASESYSSAYENFPLTGAYAWKDGTRFTVITLSRKLEGDTPVSLLLPFQRASRVTRVTLTGDPRANNIEHLNVPLEETLLLPTPDLSQGRMDFILPAGSIFAHVFEDTAGAGSPMRPQVSVNQQPGQPDPTSVPVALFQAVFDRSVTGFDATDVIVEGDAGADSVSVVPVAGTYQRVYQLKVSGMRRTGTVTVSVRADAALDASGQLSQASTSYDGTVTYEVPPPQDLRFAWDDLEISPSAAPYPPFLSGVATGGGWAGPWVAQNFDPATYAQGFELREVNLLGYPGIESLGSYAIGGKSYQMAGRPLDVSGSFGALKVYGSSPAVIGQSGTTVWISALMRKETNTNSPMHFNLVNGSYAQVYSDHRLEVGYLGAATQVGSTRYWGFSVRNAANNGFDTVRSEKVMTVGQTTLVVVKLEFGAQDTVQLYINPPLDGEAPVAADLSYTTPGQTDLVFRTLGFYGGTNLYEGSIDRIRFGDSFLAVTTGE